MNYDPRSNALLAVAKCSRARQWAAAVAWGIGIGGIWYIGVALRAGA